MERTQGSSRPKLSGLSAVNKSRLLVIFTKNPVKGEVKTRLARSVGEQKALEVYETLREHTARVTEVVDAGRLVYYSRFVPFSDLFRTEKFIPRLQKGDDLGERMFHAIKEGFEAGFAHVVLIGTDCYELSYTILNEAFSALERHDAVIGPATDGGFYLIGLNRVLPELFLDRQWSTPEVFRETATRLQRFAIEYELLTELSDIDTFEDLKKSTLWPLQP
ncbi:MAG: TIGR04282 family arsenosugar biosynthesis glycosyltransferase [Chlorobium sp.]